jgi:hypothetical protein
VPAATPGAHVILWTAIAGLVFGQVVLYVDWLAWDGDDWDVAKTGPFMLWATLISLQTAFWPFAFVAVRRIARRWRTPQIARSRELRLGTAGLVLAGLAVAFVPRSTGALAEVVPHRWEKVTVITLIAFALAIYAARALWFIAVQLRDLPQAATSDADAVPRHNRLRADVQVLLAILGVFVTLAVLSSAALRVLTVNQDPKHAVPAEAVIVYGVVLSALLALIYAPAHLAMVRSGQVLRDRLAPELGVTDPGFGDRLARREQLGKLLGLDVAASATFRTAVAILGPLLGSLTSLLPNLGS